MDRPNSICLDTADHPDLQTMRQGDQFTLTATYTVTDNADGSLYADVGEDATVEPLAAEPAPAPEAKSSTYTPPAEETPAAPRGRRPMAQTAMRMGY